MAPDTDQFTDVEIFAMTLIGESESLGEEGMREQASTVMNRAKADLKGMGGSNVRNVCLAHDQYDVWWPAAGNADRQRVLDIATNNPTYSPYVAALGIAESAIAGTLVDCTNGSVSYYDSDKCSEPYWAKGKTPSFVDGDRYFYNLAAVT
jgi:hypothetical protein